MTIVKLKDKIKEIVEAMGLTYVRATDLEGNIILENLGSDGAGIALHKDLTTVATTTSIGSYISKSISTEIYFLYLDGSIDEFLNDLDAAYNKAENDADEFYDRMLQAGILDPVVPAPGYELQRQETFKLYDASFTGVGFNCDFPVNRTLYYCNA